MTALSDVCDLIIDCEHKTAPTVPAGYPLIRTPDIGLGRLFVETALRVEEQTYRTWTKRAVPRAGDLILAREAPVGNVGIIKPGIHPVLGQRTVLIRTRSDVLDPYYLNYLLSGPELRDWMQGVSSGATVPHLNMADIRRMPLPKLPSITIQRKIAGVLTAYDDLAENNNHRIKALEEMVQRLYLEWFVDFSYPGHEHVRLIDSKHGPIPEDWTTGSLQDVIEHQIGGGWGADEPSASHTLEARVIRGTDIPRVRRGDVSSCPARYHTSANLRRRRIQAGDIVFEVSGGSKGQPVGRSVKVSDILLRELGMDTICASFCKLVRPDPSILLPEILSLRFHNSYESGEVSAYQIQSTGISNLRFSQFLESFPVLIPPMPVQRGFVECIEPMISAIDLLGIQIRNLRATRDVLLPPLVAGEIDLSDLDIAVAGVAA
jgi:type I restriction enzyme S subunit